MENFPVRRRLESCGIAYNSTTNTVVTGSRSYGGLPDSQKQQIARAIAASGGSTEPYTYMACQTIIWEIWLSKCSMECLEFAENFLSDSSKILQANTRSAKNFEAVWRKIFKKSECSVLYLLSLVIP